MNDATIMNEFEVLHDRCDNLAASGVSAVSAAAETMLRVRAYENIINQSWFLTRFFAQKKITAEMKSIDKAEGLIRSIQTERAERAQDSLKQIRDSEKRSKEESQKVSKGKKQIERLERKDKQHV